MEGWKIWALFGVIALALILGAVAATIAYPTQRQALPTGGGPLDRYYLGGGSGRNPRTMAILADAQRIHDEREDGGLSQAQQQIADEIRAAQMRAKEREARATARALQRAGGEQPDQLDPQDVACLRMLAGAHFGPNAHLTLPSGRTISSAEAQALTSAYAPAAREG